MLASVLALGLVMAGAQAEPCDPGPALTVGASDRKLPVASHLRVLADASGQLTLADVARPPACGQFAAFARSDRYETRGGEGRYWFRLLVRPVGEPAGDWLLYFHISMFDRACMHWPVAAGGYQASCETAGQGRDTGVLRHNRLVYLLPRDFDPSRPAFLELQSRAPLTVRGTLLRPEVLADEEYLSQFASGLFTGLMFATVLYNLIFFVAARDRASLFFALHVLCLRLAMLAYEGRARDGLWSWLGGWGASLPVALLSSAFLLGCLYGRDFLESASKAPRLDRLLLLAMVPAALGIPASFVSIDAAERLAAVAALAFAVALASVAAVLARRGSAPARYLLAALSVLLLGLLAESLRVLGVHAIPDAWGVPLGRAGMVLASIAISVSLGRRVLALRRERDRAEQEVSALAESLQRRERMAAIGSLVAGVAHEVRNPLFGISSTVDALEARLKQNGVGHHLGLLRSQVERLGKLMDDLLEYGRPRALERRPEDLAGMVREASSACDYLARESGSRIELVARGDTPPLLVDRKRIVQVLQNVLENALRHSPQAGVVTVEIARLDSDPSRVSVAVRDLGSGFAVPDLPHVFEPFFTRRKGGTGLGLSIVQQIVEQHGGRVEARNSEAGGGEVVIVLPASGLA